jgi:hypothetical protein
LAHPLREAPGGGAYERLLEELGIKELVNQKMVLVARRRGVAYDDTTILNLA